MSITPEINELIYIGSLICEQLDIIENKLMEDFKVLEKVIKRKVHPTNNSFYSQFQQLFFLRDRVNKILLAVNWKCPI